MYTPTSGHISEIDTKILLALLKLPANSYQIKRQIEDDSDHRMKVSNGTLLPALKRLQKQEAVNKNPDGTYTITLKGKELLRKEIALYNKLIYLSRHRKL